MEIRYACGWLVALLAGPRHQAHELVEIYRAYLSANPIRAESAVEQLRVPLQTLRRRMAESLTQKRVALTYAEFIDIGKDKLAPEVHSQLAYEISQQTVEAELILIGAIEDRGAFSLFLCRNRDVIACDDFAAIGSGAMVAEPILYQRALRELSSPLEKAMYVVYEAKRLGEISPGVGEATVIEIGTMNLKETDPAKIVWHFAGSRFVEPLEKAFRRFGPRPINELQLSGILKSALSLVRNARKNDSGSAEDGGKEETED